jgi:hypothetical protein
MDPKSERIPSVGCLLFLAADQLAAHRPSMVLFSMTRVPCKRVWVHSVHLSAVVLTATFLSLQESGHLSFRIHEEPSTNFPGGVITSLTLYTEVLDPTSRPGLPGELLSAAIKSPDGRVGAAKGSTGRLHQILGSLPARLRTDRAPRRGVRRCRRLVEATAGRCAALVCAVACHLPDGVHSAEWPLRKRPAS